VRKNLITLIRVFGPYEILDAIGIKALVTLSA
jgi:hypothetical protein